MKAEAYNKDAVDKSIKSSRQKIGGKEAKLIHALLKGRSGDTEKMKNEEANGIDEAQGSFSRLAPMGKNQKDEWRPASKKPRKDFDRNKRTMNDVDKIDEAKAQSPIAGTRLVSKHQGEDGHHAEVRYNPDYEEYQVHHYKNGKHMGEGPVSYHGSGREGREDATDTAKYETKKVSEALEPWMDGSDEPAYLRKAKYNDEVAKKKKAKEDAEQDAKGGGPALRTVKNEELVGKQHKLDKNKNGKLDKQDFQMLRGGKWKSVSAKGSDGKWASKDVKEETIEEKLNPSMGAAAYIKDFVDSKDPRFDGKTKKERIKQALAAYYGAKNEAVEIEQIDEISSGLADRYSKKAYNQVSGGTNLPFKKAEQRRNSINTASGKLMAMRMKDLKGVRVVGKSGREMVPTTEEFDAIDEAYGNKRDHRPIHIVVDGRYIATTTWAKNAKEAVARFISQHPQHKESRITTSQDR
jgi:hypothetical protein